MFLTLLLAEKSPMITHHAFFKISIDDKEVGIIKIGLFGDVVPQTVKNFFELAGRQHDFSYQKSIFHRVIDNFMIQGGDFEKGDGRGGKSIYGPKFDDENFSIKHRKFSLSMANSGKNTNGSQFFITTIITQWLDGKHVVFGHVLSGQDLIMNISKVKVNGNSRPLQEVKISECWAEEAQQKYQLDDY
ncbi:Peptidyl-prolyl cis-trans isomerase [Spironucleus salmonicida]|uniref:Peptidyl-prolyl cis-trans isomerase n=1 Tax=Spironucleus salmonicida TaxID=348837 RepID=V6LL11_9EUKA|nr:Peptidyl-prolyl cis-trans isomerase [Spironucleus salmonicida]|eukprot:EST41369.1 Peptidyl-prolyl cis-trans isomerase [Spironucleus salmonicida]